MTQPRNDAHIPARREEKDPAARQPRRSAPARLEDPWKTQLTNQRETPHASRRPSVSRPRSGSQRPQAVPRRASADQGDLTMEEVLALLEKDYTAPQEESRAQPVPEHKPAPKKAPVPKAAPPKPERKPAPKKAAPAADEDLAEVMALLDHDNTIPRELPQVHASSAARHTAPEKKQKPPKAPKAPKPPKLVKERKVSKLRQSLLQEGVAEEEIARRMKLLNGLGLLAAAELTAIVGVGALWLSML